MNDPPSLGGVECREVHATSFFLLVGFWGRAMARNFAATIRKKQSAFLLSSPCRTSAIWGLAGFYVRDIFPVVVV
jgi:hypothetical protein